MRGRRASAAGKGRWRDYLDMAFDAAEVHRVGAYMLRAEASHALGHVSIINAHTAVNINPGMSLQKHASPLVWKEKETQISASTITNVELKARARWHTWP